MGCSLDIVFADLLEMLHRDDDDDVCFHQSEILYLSFLIISELLTPVYNSGVTDNPQVLFPNLDWFGCLHHHVWACGKRVSVFTSRLVWDMLFS